ncbi:MULTISPECIES: toprim domain-containing protein [unclassified Endozoicomonas]|uniref:toprim domain-containing protein n=1 Tax=unclassified Endozoicomonas TaxID=2644528 RepID=UPI0021486DB9|nr:MULTISPECIES: toprim domain-containing protein [unclassified Endozoicomonas]
MAKTNPVIHQSPELQLFESMQAMDLAPPSLPIPDGQFNRFHVEGDKRGSRNGWCNFDNDPVPHASFGSWRTGKTYYWCLYDKKQLSFSEQTKLQESAQKAAERRDRKVREEQAIAAIQAEATFSRGNPDFGYFSYLDDQKNVGRHGDIRKSAKEIMFPVCDVDGKLMSLQFIDENGNKRFLPKGRIKGGCHLIGSLGRILCIAEGYATGASFYEFSKKRLPVAIAFNAGNLKAVAMAFKKKFPHLQIIILADNDRFTDGNPGKRKAYEAAKAVSGQVYLPLFEDGEPGTDFNDWLNIRRNRHGN